MIKSKESIERWSWEGGRERGTEREGRRKGGRDRERWREEGKVKAHKHTNTVNGLQKLEVCKFKTVHNNIYVRYMHSDASVRAQSCYNYVAPL